MALDRAGRARWVLCAVALAAALSALLALLHFRRPAPEPVVRRLAAGELACSPADLQVSCDGYGAVLHSCHQISCTAVGCGQTKSYHCEGCRSPFGPLSIQDEPRC